MTPRDIDAAVAERVMGWKRDVDDGTDYGWSGPGAPAMTKQPVLFSSDISAAWQVVEALKAKGDIVSMIYRCGDSEPWNKLRWYVEFRHAQAWAVDDSLPRAICLAALEAVKGTKEQETKA